MQQLCALGMREHIVLTPPVDSSQIRIDNEGNRHLQLAEQLVRLALNAMPVYRRVALFLR
jgi:hypothetical protein